MSAACYSAHSFYAYSNGHTPGHVAYWREDDGMLTLGDVLFNVHLLTLRTRLSEPEGLISPAPAKNRRSARKLAALQPAIICFGHFCWLWVRSMR